MALKAIISTAWESPASAAIMNCNVTSLIPASTSGIVTSRLQYRQPLLTHRSGLVYPTIITDAVIRLQRGMMLLPVFK